MTPSKIAATLQSVNQLFLPGPKRVVAKDGFQQSIFHERCPSISRTHR